MSIRDERRQDDFDHSAMNRRAGGDVGGDGQAHFGQALRKFITRVS